MKISCFILFLVSFAYSQENTLINGVLTKYNSVKDYKVNALINTDVPMIKMKEVEAVFYFMQKDQFKIKTEGIAVLPKQGINDLMKFLSHKEKYMAVESEGGIINGNNTQMIILIPNDDNEDIVMCKLWISKENKVIMKSQTTTKSAGTVKVNYYYNAQYLKFGLPQKLVFEIEVKKFKMPKSVAANIHNSKGSSVNNGGKGTITVSLYDYVINKGEGKKGF